MISFKTKQDAQEYSSLSHKLKCIDREMNSIGRSLRSHASQAKIASLTISELERLSQSDKPPAAVFSSVGKTFIKRKSLGDVVDRLTTIINCSQGSIKEIEQKLGALQISKSSLQEASETFLKKSMTSSSAPSPSAQSAQSSPPSPPSAPSPSP